jgi:2-polyprenyl-6-methoxyphenol hydroxylase-like FAD-dependent oxidoreductase
MNEDLVTDVLICGAGAAGLTLAIDLARRGIDCQLVEQMAQPFPGSRGKGIQPRTLEVFEDLGGSIAWQRWAVPIRRSACTAPTAAMSTVHWWKRARPRPPSRTGRPCCCRSS